MAPTIVIIAQGEMGGGTGQRLHERGARVLTSLVGRSAASAARAAKAGMQAIDDDAKLVAGADFVLSVVPPGEVLTLAARLAPALTQAAKKPIFVDCNAVSPNRVREVAAVIAPTGCAFVDGGIIGGPPTPGKEDSPRIYVSGDGAAKVMELRDYGLDMRLLAGGVGEASATKLGYAAITKGTVAIFSALMQGVMHAEVAPAVRAEFASSQKEMNTILRRDVPKMYPKAYRWVAEMEEIADFLGATNPGAGEMFRGAAKIYDRIATDKGEIALLDAFLEK
jgi:L-threonate 2-dehydrogenase